MANCVGFMAHRSGRSWDRSVTTRWRFDPLAAVDHVRISIEPAWTQVFSRLRMRPSACNTFARSLPIERANHAARNGRKRGSPVSPMAQAALVRGPGSLCAAMWNSTGRLERSPMRYKPTAALAATRGVFERAAV
jgi:hypothetical protein